MVTVVLVVDISEDSSIDLFGTALLREAIVLSRIILALAVLACKSTVAKIKC
jgi:hypothetical protein